MPGLMGKPRGAQNWLPSQVLAGMDVSDPEPKNWKPFGVAHDKRAAGEAREAKAGAAKSDPQQQ